MRNHLGTSFTVWYRQMSWFWLVLDQQGSGGTIGTAATEAEAVREACYSIEEMAARRRSSLASLVSGPGKTLVPTSDRAEPCDNAFDWIEWWMRVAQRITDKMLSQWTELVLRSS
jgi:hypothetical protein